MSSFFNRKDEYDDEKKDKNNQTNGFPLNSISKSYYTPSKREDPIRRLLEIFNEMKNKIKHSSREMDLCNKLLFKINESNRWKGIKTRLKEDQEKYQNDDYAKYCAARDEAEIVERCILRPSQSRITQFEDRLSNLDPGYMMETIRVLLDKADNVVESLQLPFNIDLNKPSVTFVEETMSFGFNDFLGSDDRSQRIQFLETIIQYCEKEMTPIQNPLGELTSVLSDLKEDIVSYSSLIDDYHYCQALKDDQKELHQKRLRMQYLAKNPLSGSTDTSSEIDIMDYINREKIVMGKIKILETKLNKEMYLQRMQKIQHLFNKATSFAYFIKNVKGTSSLVTLLSGTKLDYCQKSSIFDLDELILSGTRGQMLTLIDCMIQDCKRTSGKK